MFIDVANQSYLALPAEVVLQMAENSIREIEANRKIFVEKALKYVEKQYETRLFGLLVRQKYPTKALALKHAPEIEIAKSAGSKDYETCEQLIKAAKFLISAPEIAEEKKVIHVSLNDFRALS